MPGEWDAYQHARGLKTDSRHYYPTLVERGLTRGVSSLLTIGGGEGALELELAKRHGMSVCYIDPSPLQSESFRATAESLGLESRIDGLHPESFESFESELRYDLILSIHSWYRIGPNEPALRKALALLSPVGSLFLTLTSETSITETIRGDTKLLNAEALSAFADRLGLKHQFFLNEEIVPVELYVRNGAATPEFVNWLAFNKRIPVEELTAETLRAAIDVVAANEIGGTVRKSAGCLIFGDH